MRTQTHDTEGEPRDEQEMQLLPVSVLLVCKTANFTAILLNQQVTSNHIDTLMPRRGGAAPVCGRLFFVGNLIRLIVYKAIQPVHRSCGPLGSGGAAGGVARCLLA